MACCIFVLPLLFSFWLCGLALLCAVVSSSPCCAYQSVLSQQSPHAPTKYIAPRLWWLSYPPQGSGAILSLTDNRQWPASLFILSGDVGSGSNGLRALDAAETVSVVGSSLGGSLSLDSGAYIGNGSWRRYQSKIKLIFTQNIRLLIVECTMTQAVPPALSQGYGYGIILGVGFAFAIFMVRTPYHGKRGCSNNGRFHSHIFSNDTTMKSSLRKCSPRPVAA